MAPMSAERRHEISGTADVKSESLQSSTWAPRLELLAQRRVFTRSARVRGQSLRESPLAILTGS
jgi:hypothetical protein